ncbi:MAG: response regulator transcription factor [Ktedonobacteraceae bacterium]|nr:response regulator transcription factor [Ktedonobacteraceae bacterium]
MQELWSNNVIPLDNELDAVQEWNALRGELLQFACTTTPVVSQPWRRTLETHISHCTRGRASLYWEPFTFGRATECDRFCEVRYQHTRYGFLGLVPGYLVSHAHPDIAQEFAHLCALLLRFSEYQVFVHYQASGLLPLLPVDQVNKLTRREREVLLGLLRGESDDQMAATLGIEPTTVHTHRKRLYRRLEVHSAQEAALRCFTHRVVDWLDGPCSTTNENGNSTVT